MRAASVVELEAEARAQERNFASGRASSDAAGVELFRRAVEERDELAWNVVVNLYSGLLLAHAARSTIRNLVREDDQFCVDRAFDRFWRATRADGLAEFPDLKAILKYLKLCLASVLLDEARLRRRQLALSIDDVTPDARLSEDPAALATAGHSAGELWHAVQAELKTDQERVVARLSFVQLLTPRQIAARCPSEFDSIDEIYRVKRNVVERLRHSAAISAFR